MKNKINLNEIVNQREKRKRKRMTTAIFGIEDSDLWKVKMKCGICSKDCNPITGTAYVGAWIGKNKLVPYCSKECLNLVTHDFIKDLLCVVCGKRGDTNFVFSMDFVNSMCNGNNYFVLCSKECRQKHVKKTRKSVKKEAKETNFVGAPMVKRCASCKKDFDKCMKCSRCNDIWYCSKECQASAWGTHKYYCIPENETPEQTKKRLEKKEIYEEELKSIKTYEEINKYLENHTKEEALHFLRKVKGPKEHITTYIDNFYLLKDNNKNGKVPANIMQDILENMMKNSTKEKMMKYVETTKGTEEENAAVIQQINAYYSHKEGKGEGGDKGDWKSSLPGTSGYFLNDDTDDEPGGFRRICQICQKDNKEEFTLKTRKAVGNKFSLDVYFFCSSDCKKKHIKKQVPFKNLG